MKKYFYTLLGLLALSSSLLAQTPVLKETTNWAIDSISSGQIWYNYTKYYSPQSAYQVVNVIELDLDNPLYTVEIAVPSSKTTLSTIATNSMAIAGINGTYENDASFVRTKGVLKTQVSLPSDHLRYWKHEGAFFYDQNNSAASIAYGSNAAYLASTLPNIISGAPMLIDNYVPVGETFIGNVSGINLNSLEYEDYRRHQGVRHPRTAIALTANRKLLLITVDGRRSNFAEGMTAKELTQFVARYFNPQWALNLDGGGSTTMWIANKGIHGNGVVNYPCDGLSSQEAANKVIKQRSVVNFILIKETSTTPPLSQGQGTQAQPYLLYTAADLQALHGLNYANPVYVKLMNDIDMSGINWVPLNAVDPYNKSIHFEGNGHIIHNLSSKGHPYASLFGVLCGSCKNLGILNADINSTNGGGIIGGYVGTKQPTSAAFTATVEACYVSGYVEGTDGVGGIAGNVGKPYSTYVSSIQNTYSTATVQARNTSGNSRSGGIAGIVWGGGVVQTCYASGKVLSARFGAGGIAGWSDSNLLSCLSLNQEIKNQVAGNLGRIAAFMGEVGGVIAQGQSCWGSAEVVLNNAGTLKPEAEWNTGVLSAKNLAYDGETKTKEFLDFLPNYQDLGWSFVGEYSVWAQEKSNGYPILQWLYERGNYSELDGHPSTGSAIPMAPQASVAPVCWQENQQICLQSAEAIQRIYVYDVSGKIKLSVSSPGNYYQSTGLPSGFYLVSVHNAQGTHHFKIALQ